MKNALSTVKSSNGVIGPLVESELTMDGLVGLQAFEIKKALNIGIKKVAAQLTTARVQERKLFDEMLAKLKAKLDPIAVKGVEKFAKAFKVVDDLRECPKDEKETLLLNKDHLYTEFTISRKQTEAETAAKVRPTLNIENLSISDVPRIAKSLTAFVFVNYSGSIMLSKVKQPVMFIKKTIAKLISLSDEIAKLESEALRLNVKKTVGVAEHIESAKAKLITTSIQNSAGGKEVLAAMQQHAQDFLNND